MGRLAELHRAYEGTGVQFLGVCTDVYDPSGSTGETAKAYIQSTRAAYPNLVMTTALTSGLQYLPSTHIYDSSGNMIARYTGGLSNTDWINVIETLMN